MRDGEQFAGYDTGFDMWRDYTARYGVIAAYCVCRRYLQMQARTKDVPEREFCRQLKGAMAAERDFTDVGVYRRSKGYAELDGSIEQYNESDRINRLCAGDIDEAIDACSYGDGSVDYKDALTALTFRYGMERLRFVLSCEVNWDSVFGRYPDELYQWAREMNIHENYGRYGVRTRPEYLAGLIAELRQMEQTIKPPLRGHGEGGSYLKSKTDFYISFYEQLALQGFQAYMPSYDYDKKHIADICVNGSNIAYLTKTDGIEPNPHAEIPHGEIEKIREIARNTALKFAACTEKSYDETKHHEFSDGSYKLAEYNGMAMACAPHHLFGYVFSTFKYPNEIGQPGEHTTFFTQSDAAKDFAIKSGLVDERQFFTKEELAVMYVNAIKVRIMPDNDLGSNETAALDSVIEKIEGIMPELGDYYTSSELENEAELDEGVEQ